MGIVEWITKKVIPWHTGLGITPRTITLEVPGRKTGKPVRVSLSRTDYEGEKYFVSLAGEVHWVRNVRAANGQATILSGKIIPVRLEEISAEQRAPVMLAYVQSRAFLHSGVQSSQEFFGLEKKSTLERMKAIANRYVVFRIMESSIGKASHSAEGY
jgi:hypothetical protein